MSASSPPTSGSSHTSAPAARRSRPRSATRLARPTLGRRALFGEEQARIGKQMAAAKQRLIQSELRVDQLEAALDEALRLATDSEYAYRVADDQTRRGWNQDFFTKIFIREDEVAGAELTDDYAALLSDELVTKLEVLKAEQQANPKAKVTSLRAWGSIEGLVVGLTGACSNQQTRLVLADANRVRADLVALPGRSGPTTKLAPRHEPATTGIIEVLRMSDGPLAIADVLQRVEQMLGRSVSRGSLKGSLSELAASTNRPVRRVSRGRYESTSPSDA